MTAFRVQAKRTTNSGPPPDLEFGELAYSDADQNLYVGRADSDDPPTTFEGNTTDYGPAIALLNAASDSQADAIGALATSTSTLNGALVSLAADVQIALGTKANDADLAVVAKSGAYGDLSGLPTLFSGAYGDLTELPTLFSGVYGDLTGKPTIPHGFTYDQQTEPSSPPAGATWRERSAGGLVVGQWEWLSAFAEWVSLTTYELSSGASIGTTAGGNVSGYCAPIKRLIVSRYVVGIFFNGNTFNASNFHTFTPQLANQPISGTQNLASVAMNSNSGVSNKAVVNAIYTFSDLSIFRAQTGTPGNSRSVLTLEVRNCRV
jgi:hypothetical protein